MKYSLLLLTALLLTARISAGGIPFPQELDAAAVSEERLDDIGQCRLILGNGDLNALLWERNGALCLRVTKNDLWDARIDTSEDPPLLKMDIKNRTWSGGTGEPASWHKHPYPQPRCAAVVVIGVAAGKAQLDLRRAVVTASNTTVRALADRNVFLIDTPGNVSLEEVKAAQLPPATLGETDGVRWLRMVMPGDADYKQLC